LGVALSNGPSSVSSSLYSSYVNTEADRTYEHLLLFWSESYKAELKVKITTPKQSNAHVFTIINEWPKPENISFYISFREVYKKIKYSKYLSYFSFSLPSHKDALKWCLLYLFIGVSRIILRWIFRKWDVGVWTRSSWLRIGTGGGDLQVRK
jgi:hypothetical protein